MTTPIGPMTLNETGEMMTNDERMELCLVSDVLTRIRTLARNGASLAEIEALADSVHNTPRLIAEGNDAMKWLVTKECQRAASLLAESRVSNLDVAKRPRVTLIARCREVLSPQR